MTISSRATTCLSGDELLHQIHDDVAGVDDGVRGLRFNGGPGHDIKEHETASTKHIRNPLDFTPGTFCNRGPQAQMRARCRVEGSQPFTKRRGREGKCSIQATAAFCISPWLCSNAPKATWRYHAYIKLEEKGKAQSVWTSQIVSINSADLL